MKIKNILLFSLSAFFLVFIWTRFVEPNTLRVEEVNLSIDNFPEEGIKAVQVSDVHMRGFQEVERKALREIEEIDPEFIFVTGDALDWKTRNLKASISFFEKLKGERREVFFVYGNHEHKNPLLSSFTPMLKETGVVILKNEAREVKVREDSFYLLGVDDPRSELDDLDRALEGVPQSKAKILLAHSPDIFRKVKGRGIGLVLAGHTHGCQINLPILCRWFVPLKYDKGLTQGLFREEGTYLYVSRGLGESYLPLRLNSFPEITVLNIYP